jgi:hypothetical protein
VPKKEALKKKILDEAHTSMYSIHPGSTKMYHDLWEQFWWTRIKCETARYMLECDICRKVKADYNETWRIVATAKYLRLKVGRYQHGLHYELTPDCPQVRFDMGDCCSIHQIYPLHTHAHPLHSREVR